MWSRRARLQCHLRPCWVGEFPILARPDPIREGAPPYKSRFAEETRAPVASALLHYGPPNFTRSLVVRCREWKEESLRASTAAGWRS